MLKRWIDALSSNSEKREAVEQAELIDEPEQMKSQEQGEKEEQEEKRDGGEESDRSSQTAEEIMMRICASKEVRKLIVQTKR